MKPSSRSLCSACLVIVTTAMVSGVSLGQDCEGLVEIPDSRFSAVRDGTVKDRATGLMWKQCPEGLSGIGCVVGDPLSFKWKRALDQGDDAEFAGYSDWRLPSRTELMSLVLRRCYGVDIDVANFPNTPADRFWTATPAPYYAGSAWTIHFGTGIPGYGTKRDSAYVRLVRDSAACSPANLGPCTIRPAPVVDPHRKTPPAAAAEDPLAEP